MNKSRKVKICFCLAMAALFLLTGCAAVGDNGYVTRGDEFVKYEDEFVTYNMNTASDEKIEQIRDAARKRGSVRISPERPEELAVTGEALTPIDAEFRAAATPEDFDKFIEKYAPTTLAFVAVQRLARPAIDARNWAGAIEVFEKYRSKFPYYNDRIDEIIAILEFPEEGLEVAANLGGGVNTSQAEYSPVISSDGKNLYFARDCGECSGGEEVYVSRKGSDGSWGDARRFGEPLSSKGHEIPLSISSDNTTLAVYGHYEGSLGRGDIFFVNKNPDGWGELQHYPAPLNSENFESNAMYTADGKAILFVSERPGGIGDYHPKGTFRNGSYAGNTDIYVYIKGDGVSGEVINLGPVINTPYSEFSPFLHPDGKTLYFSSNGHAGLGNLDVYQSTRLNDDSWTEWSEPVNLGKEVNTPYNDWGYQIAAEGERAYFAKNSLVDSFGASDIYSISLPTKVKPSTVITISGVVTDPKGDPLVAEIRWDDLDKMKEVGYAASDPITGEYIIHLPSGGNYGYYADKPGYIGESEHFDLREYSDSYQEFVLDIVLHPIALPEKIDEEPMPGEPEVEIRMNNIFFDFNKATLRSESYMEMNRWIRMLQENEHIDLHVSGFTDGIGSEEYNQKLSERRARAVVNYLIEKGLDRDRLTAEGFGESNPVASNDTEEGRQRNRRVQVRMLNSAR